MFHHYIWALISAKWFNYWFMSVPLIYDHYMLHPGEHYFDCNWIQTPGRNRRPPFQGIHSFLIYLTSGQILPTVCRLTSSTKWRELNLVEPMVVCFHPSLKAVPWRFPSSWERKDGHASQELDNFAL